jgi:hypothetical protein
LIFVEVVFIGKAGRSRSTVLEKKAILEKKFQCRFRRLGW